MPFGITNTTTVTIQNLTDIANISSFPEFLVNVNHVIYSGILYFVLLLVLWAIFFVGAQFVNKALLNNLMMSGAIVSMISFILRAIEIENNGLVRGMLTDKQMWLFPLITIMLAGWVWMTKDD